MRPTDEEILKQEEQIRAEIAREQPLVGFLEPLDSVLEDLGATLPGAMTGYVRRIRGDGNCFFRAVGYSVICQLADFVKSHSATGMPNWKVDWKGQIVAKYQAAGFEAMATEDFVDDFLAAVADVAPAAAPSDRLAELWGEREDLSHATVVVLRLLASAQLRSDADRFAPFVDLADSHGRDVDPADSASVIKAFCLQHVECMGVESDNVQMMALAEALKATLTVHCLNTASVLTFGDGSRSLFGMALCTELLFRPGHYDLLLR